MSTLETLHEIEQALGRRVTFTDQPPTQLLHLDQSCLADGVAHDNHIWRLIPLVGGDNIYLSYEDGNLSAAELYLLGLALALGLPENSAKLPSWQVKIIEVIREPTEPFAPSGSEDELDNILVPWSWPVSMVGLRPSGRQSQAFLSEVKKTLDSLAETSEFRPFVTTDESFVLGIFPQIGMDRDGAGGGEETAQALVDSIMSESFVDLRAVWCGPVKSFAELLAMLKRMVFVALTAECLLSERRILSAKGLGIYELLFAATPQLRRDYANHILSPATLMGLGADLEQTVMMFVSCDLNMSETARQLYLHRNSLLYRIERIRELTGYDIRRFDEAVTVWSALLLKRI